MSQENIHVFSPEKLSMAEQFQSSNCAVSVPNRGLLLLRRLYIPGGVCRYVA
jgi:hypothetical protein